MKRKFINTIFKDATISELEDIADVCLASLHFHNEIQGTKYEITSSDEKKEIPTKVIDLTATEEPKDLLLVEEVAETPDITKNMFHIEEMGKLLEDSIIGASIEKVKTFPFTREFLLNTAVILKENGFKLHKFKKCYEKEGGWNYVVFESFCKIHGKKHSQNNQCWMWKTGSPKSVIKCFHDNSKIILDFPMNI